MTTDERNKFYKLRSRLAMSGLIIFFLCYWIYNLKIDIENEKSNVVAITEQIKIKDESIILLRKRLDSIVKIFNHPPIPVEKPKVKLPKKPSCLNIISLM